MRQGQGPWQQATAAGARARAAARSSPAVTPARARQGQQQQVAPRTTTAATGKKWSPSAVRATKATRAATQAPASMTPRPAAPRPTMAQVQLQDGRHHRTLHLESCPRACRGRSLERTLWAARPTPSAPLARSQRLRAKQRSPAGPQPLARWQRLRWKRRAGNMATGSGCVTGGGCGTDKCKVGWTVAGSRSHGTRTGAVGLAHRRRG